MGYNFVTKATSLVVESDDNYIKNGTIDFDTTIFRPTSYGYDYDSFSSADYYQYDTGFSVRSSAHSSSTRLSAHSSSTLLSAHSSSTGLLRPYTNFDLRRSSRSTTTTTTTTTNKEPVSEAFLSLSLTHSSLSLSVSLCLS